MSHNNTQTEDITKASMVQDEKTEDLQDSEKIKRSYSYSMPTSSMYYNSDMDSEITRNTRNDSVILDPDLSNITNLGNTSNNNITVKARSINSQNSKKHNILNTSLTTSLNNNINENSVNFSENSPLSKTSITNEKILPSNITSNSNRKSISLENKSELDNSSIIVEINDEEEEDNIDDINSKPTNETNANVNVNIPNQQQLTEINNAGKRKLELAENRISIATSGEFTYVNSQPQTPIDLPMPAKSDIVNSNLKGLTDTTSTPNPINNNVKKENSNNEVDKETADISNKEHKITIDEEEEDNTCAICLIETQKPTDIENIGSNETVVAPTKEDIDNYECKLHCMHKFHYSCIAQWLERSQNCPICRVEIKHYEIEAIEKRFDISINVKEEPLPLAVPHYNTTFEFDNELTESLVKSYMEEHFPWVNFKAYFYTKFFFYFIGYLILTIFGIVVAVLSFLKGHERLYFASYVLVIVIIFGFIILLTKFCISIKRKKLMIFMIKQPTAATEFYGFSALIFILLFVLINMFVDTLDNPYKLEKIFEYCVIVFFSIVLLWSCVETKEGYDILKEDNRRTVDAEVARRNREIVERSRREEAQEREEFERNFSHLND